MIQSRSIDGSLQIHLELQQTLDRETTDTYDVIITAYDGSGFEHSATMTSHIIVNDVNDNSPTFTHPSSTVHVSEATIEDSEIVLLEATDFDSDQNSALTFEMTERSQTQYGNVFRIDSTSGGVYLQSGLDYEQTKDYNLFFVVKDNGVPQKSSMSSLHVIVEDVNDCIPQISVNTLTTSGDVEVAENSQKGTFVAHVSVFDDDSDVRGEVVCKLKTICTKPDCQEPFFLQHLHGDQYKVTTALRLDREERDEYLLTVQCHDNGTPALEASSEIRVYVLDVNDHAPKWPTDKYDIDVQENNIPKKTLLQVGASDDDIGVNARVTYRLSGEFAEYFTIDSATGLIKTARVLDHERQPLIKLTLIATDDAGEEALSSTTSLHINVRDMNDEVPQFEEREYTFVTRENQPSGELLGSVSAIDKDGAPYNIISYALVQTPTSDMFSIDSKSGELRTAMPLDREKHPQHYLSIVATNPGFTGLSSSTDVIVDVTDLNDNWPVITHPNISNNSLILSPDLSEGSFAYHLKAYDKDLGVNSELVYHITSGDYKNLFFLNQTTGTITTAKDLKDVDGMNFELIVQVADKAKEPKVTFATLAIKVEAVPLFLGSYIELNSKQLIIFISCLALVFIFFLVVMILLIIFCRRRCRRRNQTIKETESMLKSRDIMSASTTQTTLKHSESKQTEARDSGGDISPGGQEVTYQKYQVRHEHTSHFD